MASIVRDMIGPNTLMTITQLSAPSYSKKEAARILDIGVPKMMAMNPHLEKFPGYQQPRISRGELKRLLERGGLTFQPEKEETVLPARTARKLRQICGQAGV